MVTTHQGNDALHSIPSSFFTILPLTQNTQMARNSKPGVDAAVADYRRGVFPSIRAAARAYNVAEASVR